MGRDNICMDIVKIFVILMNFCADFEWIDSGNSGSEVEMNWSPKVLFNLKRFSEQKFLTISR